MLPGISHLVKQIVELKQKLDEQGYDVNRLQYFGGSEPDGQKFFPAEVEKFVDIAKKISKKGIIIKSIDEGLIDFPHIRSNEEEVYLCWRLGEKDIDYWHSIPDGFAGRKPVEEL